MNLTFPETEARCSDPIESEDGWTSKITPHRGWMDWRLAQLWRYRDLITLFVWRDFVSAYKQTILGPAWHIIQPLLTTLTFTIIFGKVAKLPTDGTPPFLFYLAGTVLWSYFSTSLTKTANTFVGNAHLMGKVYFHRLVIPISIVISNLISFGIQFAIFVAAVTFYYFSSDHVHPTAWAFSCPILVAMMAGFSLGFGIIVSALTTRYRDLANLVSFGVQLLMYATPVIYPLSSIPARYQWVSNLNPLTPVMETFRLGFLGIGTVSLPQLTASFAVMCGVLGIGMMLFTHVERSFMDTV
jgi:lipopolysaccharide transport system permease protein